MDRELRVRKESNLDFIDIGNVLDGNIGIEIPGEHVHSSEIGKKTRAVKGRQGIIFFCPLDCAHTINIPDVVEEGLDKGSSFLG